jgi:hypothetical protein
MGGDEADETNEFPVILPVKFDEVPRRLQHRRMPEKRDLDIVDSSSVCHPELKKRRMVSESAEVSATLDKIGLGARSQDKLDSSKLEAATEKAYQIYKDVWTRFLKNRYWQGDKNACKLAEAQANELYEEACEIAAELLRWVNIDRCKLTGDSTKGYAKMQFQGSVSGKCFDLFGELDFLRQSEQGRARDALCAILAVLSCRSDKCWLDGLQAESVIQEGLKWNRNKRKKLEEEVAAFISRKIHGHFGRKLVDPRAIFRMAFAIDELRLKPASLLITYHLPLKDALKKMDGEGPLEDFPHHWFFKPSRQFAFQQICCKASTERTDRKHAWTLSPEPQIKNLLCSHKPVVLLDALSALAPRKRSKEHGLSKIVQSELAALLRQAKAQGQAVVFMLGGAEPHKLAEKVYLQPPFTDYGLRCGYLRWRGSPRQPWAREKLGWSERPCIGLQLP